MVDVQTNSQQETKEDEDTGWVDEHQTCGTEK